MRNLILFLIVISVWLSVALKAVATGSTPLISVQGETQGTTYSIKYYDDQQRDFKKDIDSIFRDFDRCLSTYRPDSEISIFNNSHAVRLRGPYFYPVLQKSKEIFLATNGAFDPTVMPLVEAYGFGPKKNLNPGLARIDSLLKLVGFEQITFDSIMVSKSRQHVRLDFNGIAQGYSVDVIGAFLSGKGITRFMVEIGGEILCKGYKDEGKPWVTGIENPLLPGTLYSTVRLTDRAMTTAGNYRNHFEKNGQIFNHIINPKTGSMEQSSVLSVTVFANDAITADGYDTAFFIMGLEETKRFLEKRKDMDAYIMYSDTSGKLRTYASDGIKNMITETSAKN